MFFFIIYKILYRDCNELIKWISRRSDEHGAGKLEEHRIYTISEFVLIINSSLIQKRCLMTSQLVSDDVSWLTAIRSLYGLDCRVTVVNGISCLQPELVFDTTLWLTNITIELISIHFRYLSFNIIFNYLFHCTPICFIKRLFFCHVTRVHRLDDDVILACISWTFLNNSA